MLVVTTWRMPKVCARGILILMGDEWSACRLPIFQTVGMIGADHMLGGFAAHNCRGLKYDDCCSRTRSVSAAARSSEIACIVPAGMCGRKWELFWEGSGFCVFCIHSLCRRAFWEIFWEIFCEIFVLSASLSHFCSIRMVPLYMTYSCFWRMH